MPFFQNLIYFFHYKKSDKKATKKRQKATKRRQTADKKIGSSKKATDGAFFLPCRCPPQRQVVNKARFLNKLRRQKSEEQWWINLVSMQRIMAHYHNLEYHTEVSDAPRR